MFQKPANLKRRRALRFGVIVLGLVLLLPAFIKSEPVRAESPGGTCIAATQDSVDKLIANYGDRYTLDAADLTRTHVVLTTPVTAADADVVCVPDLRLKQLIDNAATPATDITFANIKALPTNLTGSGTYSSPGDMSSLIGLEYAEQLTDLSLEYEELSDLTPLAGLADLKYLSLYNNQISDVTPLNGLIDLIGLDLSDNNISNIAPLTGLINLTDLDLSDNQISVIASLDGLDSLEYLIIHSNQIIDVSGLVGLDSLIGLAIYHNQISDITPIAGLASLEWLDLYSNEIYNLPDLSGLVNLDWLDLGYNSISDITSLGELDSLIFLSLDGNSISDITSLGGLINLTDLYLHNNQISDVTPLANLTNLNTLDLDNNRISDISSLAAIYQAIQSSGTPWTYFTANNQEAFVDVTATSVTIDNPLRQFDNTVIQPDSVNTTYATYNDVTNQFSLFDLPELTLTEFATFELNCAQSPGDDPTTTVCFSGTLSAQHGEALVVPPVISPATPKSGVGPANHGAIAIGVATLGLGTIALAIVKQRKTHFKK